jgi:hypothetical protein
MEQVLRSHREHALKLLRENKGQSREGVELLVRGRLATIASLAQPKGTVSQEQLESLYQEVCDLSYAMFALGYTMARSGDEKK